MADFTAEDQVQALMQGWGIFDVDTTGVYQLQRDDEQARFSDDEGAWCFVISWAMNGDKLCERAMDFIKERSLKELEAMNAQWPILLKDTRWEI